MTIIVIYIFIYLRLQIVKISSPIIQINLASYQKIALSSFLCYNMFHTTSNCFIDVRSVFEKEANMPYPSRKRTNGSLDLFSHRSNVKSFSEKSSRTKSEVQPLLLCLLIIVSMIVFGFTKSQELLPIISTLVGAFLGLLGYSHFTSGPGHPRQ